MKRPAFVGPKTIVFAHFDQNRNLSAADEASLRSYRRTGYQLLMVSTSLQCPDVVSNLVDGLIVRPNIGFDFASWACAIEEFLPRQQRLQIEHLVLVNNSVFGPLWDPSELLRCAQTAASVVGLTESLEFDRHLQSYFMSFDGRVIRSEAFETYWTAGFGFLQKWPVIIRGELQWERHFRVAGMSTSHLVPRVSGVKRNELTFYWSELIRNGLPYVKKSLFGHNYDHIDVRDWQKELKDLAPLFDQGLIEGNLC